MRLQVENQPTCKNQLRVQPKSRPDKTNFTRAVAATALPNFPCLKIFFKAFTVSTLQRHPTGFGFRKYVPQGSPIEISDCNTKFRKASDGELRLFGAEFLEQDHPQPHDGADHSSAKQRYFTAYPEQGPCTVKSGWLHYGTSIDGINRTSLLQYSAGRVSSWYSSRLQHLSRGRRAPPGP